MNKQEQVGKFIPVESFEDFMARREHEYAAEREAKKNAKGASVSSLPIRRE